RHGTLALWAPDVPELLLWETPLGSRVHRLDHRDVLLRQARVRVRWAEAVGEQFPVKRIQHDRARVVLCGGYSRWRVLREDILTDLCRRPEIRWSLERTQHSRLIPSA